MCPTSKQGCRSYWLLWVPSALWRESSAPWLCSVYALSFCSPPATWFIIILFYPIPFRDYSVVLHKQKYPKKQLCFAPAAVLSPVVGAIAPTHHLLCRPKPSQQYLDLQRPSARPWQTAHSSSIKREQNLQTNFCMVSLSARQRIISGLSVWNTKEHILIKAWVKNYSGYRSYIITKNGSISSMLPFIQLFN